jgi:hypothetical protein
MPLVGFLGGPSAAEWGPLVTAFQRGLKERRGRKMSPSNRWAEGQYDRLPGLAADLENCGERRREAAAPLAYANRMLWFFSGNVRMRCPVAAKMALSTAGAATKIVGSPTPPQNPPDGMMMHSTLGMSLMRIES